MPAICDLGYRIKEGGCGGFARWRTRLKIYGIIAVLRTMDCNECYLMEICILAISYVKFVVMIVEVER